MKNYLKVVLAGKNVDIFPFDDTDEIATERAVQSARFIVSRMTAARVVAWATTGFVPKHIPTVGRVPVELRAVAS